MLKVYVHVFSVADPGFIPNPIFLIPDPIFFIPDPNFFIPDPGSKRFPYPDPHTRI